MSHNNSFQESSPYPVNNEGHAVPFSLNHQDSWLQTFQVQDTDLIPVMLDHNNLLQEFPPYTVSNESQASLVALDHQDSWLQTFQVQDTDLVPLMLDHNNLFPAYTVSNESQGDLVTLDHYDSWLPTFQVQDTNLVHAPPQLVMPSPSQNPVAQAAPAPTQLFVCPPCGRGFGRWQDRDRHVRTHLPYTYYCPFPRCPWRGDRPENVLRHWDNMHSEYQPAPSWQQCQIYHSNGLVTAILDGALTVEEAAEVALSVVAIRAMETDKGDVWENGWGRRTMTGQ